MPKLRISSAQKLLQEIQPLIPESHREFITLHSHQVARIAKLLGEQAGLDSTSMEIAGYIHDIGYSRDMETHPQESLNILRERNFEINDTIKDCILNHGTSAQPLTEEGKLFQLADKLSVFDYQFIEMIIKEDGLPISEKSIGFLEYLANSAIKLLRKNA